MYKIYCLFLSLFVFISIAKAQIKTPTKKPINIGVFTGVGGVNFSPIPGLDFAYKKTIVRVAPGYRAVGGGIIREIIPFSSTFYNCLWIASLYAGIEDEDDVYPSGKFGTTLTTRHTKFMLMSGAKYYFGKRWYSQLQIGVINTRDKTPGFSDRNKVNPYFEFSLGINIFKTYKNEIVEEGVNE